MIETVPFISDINITEKIILYSDKILFLKENDIPLCITTINNISPYMLENKIEEIFNTHKDINYYKIQYNEKDKLLIFYTYEPLISNNNNNNNNNTIMKQENLKDNNLYNYYEEIQKGFDSLSKIESMIPLKNETTVSLQDIINTYYIMNQEYENQKNKTKEQFDNLLAKRETKKQLRSSNIIINFEENEIEYQYKFQDKTIFYPHYVINIKMINNKLFFTNFEKEFGNEEEEQIQKKKIIENYEAIKEIIINILKYKVFKETEQIIQSINSKIILNINNNLGVYKVYYKNKNSKFSIEINEKETTINSESLELYHYLSENLDNIKEQLFFRKIDCPIWMQEYWEKNKKEETVSKEIIIEPIHEEETNENESLYTTPIEKANQKLKSRWSFFSQYF